jgi:hypothetical protein
MKLRGSLGNVPQILKKKIVIKNKYITIYTVKILLLNDIKKQ